MLFRYNHLSETIKTEAYIHRGFYQQRIQFFIKWNGRYDFGIFESELIHIIQERQTLDSLQQLSRQYPPLKCFGPVKPG
jgi:hypothetical protein